MENGDRDKPQVPKDFAAITHGNEWVSFYESFDKMVQENLTRSSELLRRAMSLPEIADREVQQIKAEAEERIQAERSHQRQLLSGLHADLAGSQSQIASLAAAVSAVVGDLDRLASRVGEALSGIEAGPELPAPVVDDVDEFAAEVADIQASIDAIADDPSPAELVAEAESPFEAMPELELPEMQTLPDSDFDLSAIQAAVEEQQAMMEAAEQHLETIESSIDLNALAEAEAATAPVAAEAVAVVEEPVAVGAGEPAAAPDQRPRPHWLSVTRVGSRS